METSRLPVAVVWLVLAACTPAASEPPPMATSPSTTGSATSTIPTTTTPPPSTLASGIVEPTPDALARYLAAATARRERYHPSTMGSEAFAAMLEEGAIAACQALGSDASIAETIAAALSRTPAAGEASTSHGDDEFVLAATLVIAGTATYCPSLAPRYEGDGSEVMEAFYRDWLRYLHPDPSA